MEVVIALKQSGGIGGSAAVGGGGRGSALISLGWMRSLVPRVIFG
jgi:hypothetical protein